MGGHRLPQTDVVADENAESDPLPFESNNAVLRPPSIVDPPRQVLGRRNRQESPELIGGDHSNTHAQLATLNNQVVAAGESSVVEGEPQPKRRRNVRMRLDSDSATNGSTKAASNGAVATKPSTTLAKSSGKTSGTMNGSSHTNGDSQEGEKPRKTTYYGHDREEVTRLLIQSLSELGYQGAANTLSHESGYDLETPTVAAFRNAVLHGQWATAEELLFGTSTPVGDGGVSLHGEGLALADVSQEDRMKFWLREQKFLELLEARETGRALMVLRTELTPLNQDISKLHFLSR